MTDSMSQLERDANMTLARSASACKRAKARKDKAFKTIGDATRHLAKPKGESK